MLMQCVVRSSGSYLLWEVRRYCPAILETVQGKHFKPHDFMWNSFTYLLLSVSVACKPVTFWWLRTLREISEIVKTNQNFRNETSEISCRPAKREPQIMQGFLLTRSFGSVLKAQCYPRRWPLDGEDAGALAGAPCHGGSAPATSIAPFQERTVVRSG